MNNINRKSIHQPYKHMILSKLFTDLLLSRVNDLLKLSERYHIGRLCWPILSTIGLSDFHTIVLTRVFQLTNKTWLSATGSDLVTGKVNV